MPLRFNRTDKLILVFSITVVIVFSFFMYDDSFLFEARESNNAKIGNLQQAENDVRLRASDSFTWNTAKKTEVVFERDSIFTGKRSRTQIDLVDGSKIFLSENSLVTLVAKNGKLELNLRYGTINTEINPSSQLQLIEGTQKILLNKNSGSSILEIKKPKYGLTKIKLLKGNLSVKHSAAANSQPLVKEQTVIVKPTGVLQKILPGSIDLITPNRSEFYTEAKGFYLNWNSQNMDKNTLLVSKDNDFKSVVISEPNIKTKMFVKNLPVGNYYWKIFGTDLNGSQIQSETRLFSVQMLERLSIIEPGENKKWTIEVKGNINQHKEPVKISWTNIYDTVQTQISKSSDFKELAYNQELNKTFSISLNIPAGIYFVRVRGKKSTFYTEWSDVRTFEISVKIKNLITPSVPELLSRKLTFSPASGRTPSSLNPVTLKWKPARFAVRYELEVSLKDPKFSKPLRIPIKNTQAAYIPKDLGSHYYRVRAVSSDNINSAYSEIGELQINLRSPTLTKVPIVTIRSIEPSSTPPPTNFKLNWSAVPLATNYIIQLAEHKDFVKVETLTSPSTSVEVPVAKAGKYFFRVLASDSDQIIKSLPSNIETSEYNYFQRQPKPILIEPKNKMTVFLQKDIEPFIWLYWNSVNHKQNFELEIALDESFEKIVLQRKLTENRFLIKNKLPLSKIYWRVRQTDEDPTLVSEWTEIREFQLIHQKNEGVFK